MLTFEFVNMNISFLLISVQRMKEGVDKIRMRNFIRETK